MLKLFIVKSLPPVTTIPNLAFNPREDVAHFEPHCVEGPHHHLACAVHQFSERGLVFVVGVCEAWKVIMARKALMVVGRAFREPGKRRILFLFIFLLGLRPHGELLFRINILGSDNGILPLNTQQNFSRNSHGRIPAFFSARELIAEKQNAGLLCEHATDKIWRDAPALRDLLDGEEFADRRVCGVFRRNRAYRGKPNWRLRWHWCDPTEFCVGQSGALFAGNLCAAA